MHLLSSQWACRARLRFPRRPPGTRPEEATPEPEDPAGQIAQTPGRPSLCAMGSPR